MRLVAACVLASIAGCGDRECTLQGELDVGLAGETPMSCGELYSDFTPPTDLSAWSAAHDCVVTAATARTPFRVSWSRVLLEGLEDGVLVGVRHDGAWQLRRVVRTTSNGASFVRTTGCSGLEDQGGCPYLVSTLCVRCLDAVEHASCDTR